MAASQQVGESASQRTGLVLPERVVATPAALQLIAELQAEHGPVLFYQSGGCCEGSAPMCFPVGEMRIGSRDVKLAEIAGAPFYMSAQQFEYWKHTQLEIDVVPGFGAAFSLEGPGGLQFITRSHVFTDEEIVALRKHEESIEDAVEREDKTCDRAFPADL